MNYAIVIPNWNGRDFIAPCLDSLASQTIACHVIVVDNGSTDGSMELIKSDYPGVQLIELDKNYGFAGGVNRGIEAAITGGADYVALFNNDAEAASDWVEQLVRVAEANPDVGIVTGKFLKFHDRTILDSTGDFYSIWGMPFPRGRDEVDKDQYDSLDQQFVFGATGGASLYRTETLRQIGLFDEAFFAYYEDVDISFRAQLGGWKVRYAPEARAYHRIGGTSSKMGDFARYQTIKNFYYVYLKNMPARLFWKYIFHFVAGALLITASSWRNGQIGTWFRAIGRVVITLPHLVVERRRIQHGRKVSTGYINGLLYKHIPPVHKRLGRNSPPPAIR